MEQSLNDDRNYRKNVTGGTERESDSGQMEACIRACLECYQECTSCVSHCLSQGGEHVEQRHITLMLECAKVCELSVSMMSLGGEFAGELCQLCARVCDACAQSCASIEDDAHMQECASTCRECAETCRTMAQ